jgi:hypothetical protein
MKSNISPLKIIRWVLDDYTDPEDWITIQAKDIMIMLAHIRAGKYREYRFKLAKKVKKLSTENEHFDK